MFLSIAEIHFTMFDYFLEYSKMERNKLHSYKTILGLSGSYFKNSIYWGKIFILLFLSVASGSALLNFITIFTSASACLLVTLSCHLDGMGRHSCSLGHTVCPWKDRGTGCWVLLLWKVSNHKVYCHKYLSMLIF